MAVCLEWYFESFKRVFIKKQTWTKLRQMNNWINKKRKEEDNYRTNMYLAMDKSRPTLLKPAPLMGVPER